MTCAARIAMWATTSLSLVPLVLAAQDPRPEQVANYKLDPVHTSMWFKINHMGIAEFYGRFNDLSGEFTLSEKPEQCRLEVAIQTGSVDTNNKDRDKHLRSADFFDADQYPLITFKAREFKPAGEKAWEVRGELSLHGVSKELTIKLKQTGAGKDPWGNQRVGLHTEFSIKRSDFNMTHSMGALGDEVTLAISVEGIQQ